MNSTEFAIEVEGLRKRYRGAPETAGLTGLNLQVKTGSVCGLLGPNGAGKTTAVRILTTLLAFDAGNARVAGFDLRREAAQVRRQIGLVGQHAAVDEILSGPQNLEMFGRLYHVGGREARRRGRELTEQFGLGEMGNKPVAQYSGGMRRRLDLAISLIVRPKVLFLDEPTSGLDPRSRREVWTAVRGLVGTGTTVLLTTQYLEEADQVANQISVINGGRVIAEGTPAGLKARFGGGHVEIVVREGGNLPQAAEALSRRLSMAFAINQDSRSLSADVKDGAAALLQVTRAVTEEAVEIEDLSFRRPTLDEVFLHLTEPVDRATQEVRI